MVTVIVIDDAEEPISGMHWIHGKFGLVIHAAFWIAQNASPPRSHSSPRQLFTTKREEAEPSQRMHGKFEVATHVAF